MREHEEAFGAAAGAGAGGPAAEAKHGGSSGGGGDTEHRLEAHDVYRQFTAMVERQLEEALAGKGVAVGDFMRLSADLADDGGSSGIEDDQALQAFLQLVLGATDARSTGCSIIGAQLPLSASHAMPAGARPGGRR